MANRIGVETMKRIALIGNFPPRLCGIATFTRDVQAALTGAFPDLAVDAYAMTDAGGNYAYPPEVCCEIHQDDITDYAEAARAINASGADAVLIQHEYGIFGGPAGMNLLRLLDRVDAPVVVTLHTVLEHPNTDQRTVIEAIVRRAAKLIVMAEKGRELLQRVHGVPADRIAVVPHGVPDRPLADSDLFKGRFGFEGRRIMLTMGLLSPNKGIEHVIRALPGLVSKHPDLTYVILGATHPHLLAREGEAYRESLSVLAAELGVADHVVFHNHFVEQERLLDYIAAADIYVTPYLNEAQITSGTLSYAIALGKPVVSTPYWHASELLADGVGKLVPFADSSAIAAAVSELLDDPAHLDSLRHRAWAIGRTMLWPRLAESYVAICEDAVRRNPLKFPRGPRPSSPLEPRLDAVERMTDGTGILQHAIFTVPDRNHGYCVDDNCRALMLMHRIDGELVPRADELAEIYAAFVQHAWNGNEGRFRNFMGFDRGWLESVGSDDSFGRSLWALGVTVSEARSPELRRWGLHLFDQVAPHVRALGSPRTWAFAILAADAVLEAHAGHVVARAIIADFGGRLHALLIQQRRDDWIWFESVLSYDNSRLPEALIRAALRLDDPAMLRDGVAALGWIDGVQTNEDGQFRAVGTDSFGHDHAFPALFDQQPLEAWATIDAMLLAYRVTGEQRWKAAADRAWNWYLGDNDVGLPIGLPETGGCFDGLMSDRTNRNQGAESILAFQFATCAMARFAKREMTSNKRLTMAS
ncbi:Glycosyltransferase involved in cell wall bisynthesis [Sphingomonas sp. YR710]|uniref:glycosyltransferase family 4 protein n=1 Tax=Sphingomonas sp. YR710 TaxID=1882773 RepID=UPI00088D2609|nr:glycosyltransferase family 4 protein [Sphingomonas sp. YR710]SDD66651.1 Glycosyltransferase involved in cell wall bisynthesis [Sphingomonas sp. YR710]